MPTVHSVGDALLQLLNQVFQYVPKVISAAIVLVIGYFIAKLVRTLLTKVLRTLRFDQLMDRAGISRALHAAGSRLDAAGLLGLVAFWWIFLYFIEMALNSLALPTVTAYINQVLGYIPDIFAAILIVVIGALIANVAASATRGAAAEAGLATGRLLGGIVRWGILLFAGLAALTELNIAQNMIFILFAAIVFMLALAGGLAFGLGGRDTAAEIWRGVYEGGKQAAPQLAQAARSPHAHADGDGLRRLS